MPSRSHSRCRQIARLMKRVPAQSSAGGGAGGAGTGTVGSGKGSTSGAAMAFLLSVGTRRGLGWAATGSSGGVVMFGGVHRGPASSSWRKASTASRSASDSGADCRLASVVNDACAGMVVWGRFVSGATPCCAPSSQITPPAPASRPPRSKPQMIEFPVKSGVRLACSAGVASCSGIGRVSA